MVRYIRLVDGTDIIGKIVETNGVLNKDTLEIEQPIRVILVPQTGQVAIAPFLPFTSEKVITFNCSEIKYNLPAESDMVNMWNEKFGSGLALPVKPSLVMPG